jgi:F0F1-type ATP synthase assembly protein I
MANRTGPSVTTFQALAVASQFGITLAVCVVLGYLAGHWLDDRLNTGIIFTLIGVLLGLVAAVLNTARLYSAVMRRSEPETMTQNAPTTESVRRANEGNTLDEDEDAHDQDQADN